MLQKINDSYTGFLEGDAGGAGLEMISTEIIGPKLHFNNFIDMREPNYRINYLPGNITDDSADMIEVTKLLISKDPFDKEHLLRNLLQGMERERSSEGHLRQGYGSIKDVANKHKTIQKMREEQASREDPGNAPLMRTLPLAFIEDTALRDTYCDVIADVTHPHPLARECTKLVVEAIRHILIHEKTQATLIDTLLESYTGTIAKDLEEIHTLPHPDLLEKPNLPLLAGPQPNPYMAQKGNIVYGLNGTCTNTAKSVIYLLKHCSTPFEGYNHALRMGGDVDSLAAIVTGTLAGRYGTETLPSYLNKTEGLDQIPDLAQEFLTSLAKHTS